MSTITIDCATALNVDQFPCKSNDYGFPVKLIIGHPDGALTVSGDTPTLAEIQTGIAGSGVNKLVVLEQITNGVRAEEALSTESGADTADGLEDIVSVNIATSGRIKLLDEGIRADLATLALLNRLRVWVVTSTGWLFGGAKGYKVSNFISPLYMEGFGKRAYHNFKFVHAHNRNATDPARLDTGFLDLTNPAGT